MRMTRGPKARRARAVNNASRRTAAGQKTSSERRGSRSQVALRPGRGLPRTGSPDRGVSVVKESHERRAPVLRLPMLYPTGEVGKRPSTVHPDGNGRSTQNLRIGGTDSTSGQRECVKFGAGRLTARRPYPRRAVAGTRRQKSGPSGPGSAWEITSQNVRPPGDRGDSAARPRQDDDGRVSAWGEARTGSAGSGPSKVAVTTDRGGPRPGFQRGFGETRRQGWMTD